MENKNLSKEEFLRFNKFIKINKKGCWNWIGYKDKDNYGTFLLRRKNRRAHRVSWYCFYGMIPTEMVIHHKCKNTICVNPKHLKIITKRDNSLLYSNGMGAKNAKKKFCKNGHKFDRKYGKQRYCSICQSEKTKRLRKKWNQYPLLVGI